MAFTWQQRVYIEDTDFGGIVYYVNYLKFMERARTEYLRSLGYSQQSLRENATLFVVHKVECTYLQPARLDDELMIETEVRSSGAARLVFWQRIRRRTDSTYLCEAEVQVVCVHADSLKPRRLSAEMMAAMQTV